MKLPVSLRLRGRDGVNVPDLAALDAGISRYVGKPSEDVVASALRRAVERSGLA